VNKRPHCQAPGARRQGRPRTAWIDNIKTWTGLSVVEESIRMTEDRDKWRKYARPWCGQPSDRGRLKNRTEPWGRLRGSDYEAMMRRLRLRSFPEKRPPSFVSGELLHNCTNKLYNKSKEMSYSITVDVRDVHPATTRRPSVSS